MSGAPESSRAYRAIFSPDAYRIAFTGGGIDPKGDGQQLLPGSAGSVPFLAGGSVTFSDFERFPHL